MGGTLVLAVTLLVACLGAIAIAFLITWRNGR